MYSPVGIQKLSQNQILKLLRGARIRVKHGDAHKIHASKEQHKKIMSAHKKGAGVTIQLDPFQQQLKEHLMLNTKKRGKGWSDTLWSGAKSIGKIVAPILIDEGAKALKGYAEKKLSGGALIAPGEHHPHHGEGMAFASHAVKTKRPSRVAKRGRPKKAGGALFAAGYDESKYGKGKKKKGGLVRMPITHSRIIRRMDDWFQEPEQPTAGKPTPGKTDSSKPVSNIPPYTGGVGSYSPPSVNIKPPAPVKVAPFPSVPFTRPAPGGVKFTRGATGRGKKKGCGAKKKTAPKAAPKKRGRKGKGILGSIAGSLLGGVAGSAFGGEKGKHLGSSLGGLAGEFLPF